MMCLASNQQRMYYSLQNGQVPIYQTDDDGNIIYDHYEDSDGNWIYYLDENGEKIPMETGEYEVGYTEAVEFDANISNTLTESKWQDYGTDDSTNYAQIVVSKGYAPLKKGSVIWKQSKVGYKDELKTIIDETTADYIVKGVADEGINFDLFLLQKQVK